MNSHNCNNKLMIHDASTGDQAGNLLWRLQNGTIFTCHQPKVAVVLIGTNDLGAVACQRSDITAAAGGVVSRCSPYSICRLHTYAAYMHYSFV